MKTFHENQYYEFMIDTLSIIILSILTPMCCMPSNWLVLICNKWKCKHSNQEILHCKENKYKDYLKATTWKERETSSCKCSTSKSSEKIWPLVLALLAKDRSKCAGSDPTAVGRQLKHLHIMKAKFTWFCLNILYNHWSRYYYKITEMSAAKNDHVVLSETSQCMKMKKMKWEVKWKV